MSYQVYIVYWVWLESREVVLSMPHPIELGRGQSFKTALSSAYVEAPVDLVHKKLAQDLFF
jgi:hypothetical protein